MDVDLYAELQGKIDANLLTQAARKKVAREDVGFVDEALSELIPAFQELDAMLQQLGFKSHLKLPGGSVSLILEWADGDTIKIEYRKNPETTALVANYIELERAGVLSEPEVTIIHRRDWDFEEELANIKNAIREFTGAAKDHGGLD